MSRQDCDIACIFSTEEPVHCSLQRAFGHAKPDATGRTGGQPTGANPAQSATIRRLSQGKERALGSWLRRSVPRLFLRALVTVCGRWQLQHGRGLTRDKPRDHHHLATREFERVVMNVRIVHLNLPEPGHLVLHPRPEQSESAVILDLLLEREFGAGKQTDGYS
jgi:hypothetical protein